MTNQADVKKRIDAYNQSVQGIIDRNFEQDFGDLKSELKALADNYPPMVTELALQLMEQQQGHYKAMYTKGLLLGLRSADEINQMYSNYGLPKNADSQ